MSKSPPEAAPARRPAGRAEAMLHRLDWTVLRKLDGALQGFGSLLQLSGAFRHAPLQRTD